MIEYTTRDMVSYFIEDNGITLEQTMEQLYMSDIFEKLCDVETGLYLEKSAYVYEWLRRESQDK